MLYHFGNGSARDLWKLLGAHRTKDGFSFAVWAPDVESVHVTGSFCGWDTLAHPLTPVGSSGVWAGEVRGVQRGDQYKFAIRTHDGALMLAQRLAQEDPA